MSKSNAIPRFWCWWLLLLMTLASVVLALLG